MQLSDVYAYYQNPKPRTFLRVEQAVCYTCSVLIQSDSYGTNLRDKIGIEYPQFALSDTVLYAALELLKQEGIITSYRQKIDDENEKRGRPRRMLRVVEKRRDEASLLAGFWEEDVQNGQPDSTR